MADYDVKHLNWSRYELKNGITLCVMAIPTAIYATNAKDPKGMPAYVVTWGNLLRVVAPDSQTGNPTAPIPLDQINLRPSTTMRPLTSDEPWNEFPLKTGFTLRTRTVVTEIRRINDAFDQTFMPMFAVSSSNVVDVSQTVSEQDSE
jgi:hypothetical protein